MAAIGSNHPATSRKPQNTPLVHQPSDFIKYQGHAPPLLPSHPSLYPVASSCIALLELYLNLAARNHRKTLPAKEHKTSTEQPFPFSPRAVRRLSRLASSPTCEPIVLLSGKTHKGFSGSSSEPRYTKNTGPGDTIA